MIIDLHTHSFFSDGELCPAELVQRAKVKGYSVLAITDHADFSNYRMNLDNLLAAKEQLDSDEMAVLIGVEITHVLPRHMESMIMKCREAGAELIVVHGETIVEPVAKGTNEAAIKSGADVLGHPGFISPECVKAAAERPIFLELTLRRGGCLTNGYVAKMAKEFGAKLCISTDGHSPSDLFPNFETYKNIALGAGLSLDETGLLIQKLKEFIQPKIKKKIL